MMLTRRNHFGYDLFDEFFKDPFFTTASTRMDSTLMKTDIREKDNQYLLDMELPGFSRDDVHAELKDGYLTITAEREVKKEENDEKGKYLRRERFSGTCKRSFYVGEDIQQDDIHAAFNEGILQLSIPKEAPKKIEEAPRYIPIE